MSMVVAAAISLVVLIVIIMIFAGRSDDINRTLTQCPGECVDATGPNADDPCGDTTVYHLGDKDCQQRNDGDDWVCCYDGS